MTAQRTPAEQKKQPNDWLTILGKMSAKQRLITVAALITLGLAIKDLLPVIEHGTSVVNTFGVTGLVFLAFIAMTAIFSAWAASSELRAASKLAAGGTEQPHKSGTLTTIFTATAVLLIALPAAYAITAGSLGVSGVADLPQLNTLTGHAGLDLVIGILMLAQFVTFYNWAHRGKIIPGPEKEQGVEMAAGGTPAPRQSV